MTGGAAAALGVSATLPGCVTRPMGQQPPFSFGNGTTIKKFAVSLPGLGPKGANELGQYIPLATKTEGTFAGQKVDRYAFGVTEYSANVSHDLAGPTKFWGYYDKITGDKRYLGGVVVAKRGTPVMFDVTNELPDRALLPIDPTIMAGDGKMVGDLPLNRHATHLHGGFSPWFSDGTPMQWFDPKGATGVSFMNVPGTSPDKGTATYWYSMDQSARLMWFHDHAMGLTRTNAYAGIASALVLVDDFEIGLVNKGLLPDLVGIPLIIQDKSFVPEGIESIDPGWKWGKPGELWYPHTYAPNVLPGGKPNPKGRYEWGETAEEPSKGTEPLPEVSVVPEAFFDTILINGAPYPTATVEPRRVRFRMLNGSQARFYHINLLAEDTANPGEAKKGAAGPTIYQVGTEGGFLPAVAVHDNRRPLPMADPETANPDGPFNLLLAPAERADVIIDFNGVPEGTAFILYNDAPSPFPGGDSRNDYFTGDKDQEAEGGAPATKEGYGANTRTLMKIVVGKGKGDSVPTAKWVRDIGAQLKANFLTGNQPGLLHHAGDPSVPAFPYTGKVHRKLTINEDFDEHGRLLQRIGTMTSKGTNNQGKPTWALGYEDTATETPVAGATEVWDIYNLSMDVHPIHFHLVNVQVLQRRKFEGDPDEIKFTGAAFRPEANELGWKETVRCNPMEVTTVMMRFDLPKLPSKEMTEAVSPRTGGREYVWHCHILEHEEHDMMRPLIVR
jgi:spore coat protein A